MIGRTGDGCGHPGQGMQTENRADDYSEGAERAGREFRKIVAGNIFDDFAAAAGEGSIGKSQSNADQKIAKSTEADAQDTAVVGGKDAADGGTFGPKGVECETLAVVGERLLQGVKRTTGFDGYGEIGPDVFKNTMKTGSRENQVGTLGRISPIELGAPTTRGDCEAGFIGIRKDSSELLIALGRNNEFREDARDAVRGRCKTDVLAADQRCELLFDGTSG